jgi:hypothetical protein
MTRDESFENAIIQRDYALLFASMLKAQRDGRTNDEIVVMLEEKLTHPPVIGTKPGE